MRVLLLTTSYPSIAYPVSGIFIQRMLQQLPESVRITVVTPDSDHPDSAIISGPIKTIRFRYAPRSRQILAHKPGGLPAALQGELRNGGLIPSLLMAMSWATIVQAFKNDLIHAQWSVCGVMAGLVGVITNKPVITTLRGTDILWAGVSPAFRQTVKSCGWLSARVVTQSYAMADQLGRWFPHFRKKIVVIPNGVGGRYPPTQTQRGQAFTIGVVGNLIPLKRNF